MPPKSEPDGEPGDTPRRSSRAPAPRSARYTGVDLPAGADGEPTGQYADVASATSAQDRQVRAQLQRALASLNSGDGTFQLPFRWTYEEFEAECTGIDTTAEYLEGDEVSEDLEEDDGEMDDFIVDDDAPLEYYSDGEVDEAERDADRTNVANASALIRANVHPYARGPRVTRSQARSAQAQAQQEDSEESGSDSEENSSDSESGSGSEAESESESEVSNSESDFVPFSDDGSTTEESADEFGAAVSGNDVVFSCDPSRQVDPTERDDLLRDQRRHNENVAEIDANPRPRQRRRFQD